MEMKELEVKMWDAAQNRDAEAFLEIEDEPYSGDFVRKQLFKVLRGQ